MLSTFHYTLLDKCRALLSVIERGWPNALDFSLDFELNIPRMYCLMNNSFLECFVDYLMNSNCTCVRSTTLDNFALDQTSLDKNRALYFTKQGGQTLSTFHSNMHVERCIVKSRERLARAKCSWLLTTSAILNRIKLLLWEYLSRCEDERACHDLRYFFLQKVKINGIS